MKKAFLILVAAASLTACSNSASTTADKKDSVDSVASVKKDIVDSSADAKKDKIDSSANKTKEAIEKKDSAVHADTTKK